MPRTINYDQIVWDHINDFTGQLRAVLSGLAPNCTDFEWLVQQFSVPDMMTYTSTKIAIDSAKVKARLLQVKRERPDLFQTTNQVMNEMIRTKAGRSSS